MGSQTSQKNRWRGPSVLQIGMIFVWTVVAVTGGFFLGRGVRGGQNGSESPPKGGFVVAIKLNETLNFGDALHINLTEIAIEDDQPKITAKIFLKDEPEMQFRKAEEGSAVTYPEDHGYKITVLKIEPDSARFSIVKNP